MEFDEKTYDKIDRYLANELKGEELDAFEKEKNSNKALAEEIEVNAHMKEFLSDSPENDLRKNLHNLGNQFEEKEEEQTPLVPISKGNSLKYLFQVAAAIFLAAMAWWIYNQSTTKENNDEPQIVDQPKDNLPDPKQKPVEIQKEDVENTENLVEEYPNQKEDIKIQTPKDPIEILPPKKETRDLYAANFKPNPSLELLVNNNLRSNDFELNIDKQIGNVSISSLEDVVSFNFGGTINSDENLLEKDLKIHLFSNDKKAYDDFSSILSDDLKLEETKKETYNFDFSKYIVLKPGVYYYLLEDVGIEKIYHVGKFEVRLK